MEHIGIDLGATHSHVVVHTESGEVRTVSKLETWGTGLPQSFLPISAMAQPYMRQLGPRRQPR